MSHIEEGKRFIQVSNIHNSARTHRAVNDARTGKGKINVHKPPYIRAVVTGIRNRLAKGPSNGNE